MELKKSSRQQQSSNAVKEKIPSTQARQGSKFQEKPVVLNPFDELVMQKKSSITLQKQHLVSKTNKDDELVKHMSNLPGYLQRVEKQKNVQVKALNFGVLDWNRLEKWKYNERMPKRGLPKASTSGSSVDIENGKSTVSKTSVGRKQPSVDLRLDSATEIKLFEHVQHSKGKCKNIQDPQTASWCITAGQQKDFCQKAKNSSRSCPQINHDKGKKKEADIMPISQQEAYSLDQMEHSISMSSRPRGYQQCESRTGGGNNMNGSPKYTDAEPQNIVLLMPKYPSKRSSFRSFESRISPNEHLAKDARNRYSGWSSSHEHQSGEVYNKAPCSSSMPTSVATARDRKSDYCLHSYHNDAQSCETKCPQTKNCSVDRPISLDTCEVMDFDTANQTNSRTSSRGQLVDGDRIRYYDYFCPQESHNRGLYYEIPHSCPLPASVAISQDRESDVWTHPFQSDTSTVPKSSGATCPETKSCNLDDSVSFENFKGMDLDSSTHTAGKKRHPSPNRRFSFSLGRLSRSFSFKESSAGSAHAAAESGRENSDVFAAVDESKVDKANANSRRRPSPFRRLLDPLLKPKGGHSTESVQSKGALSPESFQVLEKSSSFATVQPISNINKPLSNETTRASSLQALMQLTIKNGLPFFKFVVDDRSDILAAAVNQLPIPGKAGSTLTFSFYSVHEIKKKTGGWISNGSKEKNCGFGYDIVGQMKMSRSFFSELNAEGCNDHFMVTESVLYGVNNGEGDKGALGVPVNREIAAVIFKKPAARYNDEKSKVGHTCKQTGFIDYSLGNTHDHGEKENFTSTIAILPGGFHSFPKEGAPSSLIYRWKSGGLCDCGGWDIGCKLKVLTDHKKGSNSSTPAVSCSTLEHMNLFIQGGEGKGQPFFSLAPLKDGFHSVEFNASVSLLEAFSICVAVITSRVLSDIFDIDHLPEAKVSVEAKTENDTMKNNTSMVTPGEVPAKYVSCPPPSPVERI